MELFHDVTLIGWGRSGTSSPFLWSSAWPDCCRSFFWHGIPLGIDFRGGTLVYVNSSAAERRPHPPGDRPGRHPRRRIQPFGTVVAERQVIISLAEKETQESALEAGAADHREGA